MQVFWESNGVYVVSRSEFGNKLVFSQAGPSTQMVQLEATLVGIFNLRFYTVDGAQKKTFLVGGPEVVSFSLMFVNMDIGTKNVSDRACCKARKHPEENNHHYIGRSHHLSGLGPHGAGPGHGRGPGNTQGN